MSREDAQMKVRLPADLKEMLEDAAKFNKRSLNAEVLYRLRGSFTTDEAILEETRKFVDEYEADFIRKLKNSPEKYLIQIKYNLDKSNKEFIEYQEKILQKLAELKKEGDGN
ncbi:Arc family DNA-binding protein [Salmonella enterica]|nr:Arc family DNA-binding protein [Salmonella enterica]EHR3002229.1 Arc family DNA-binding protein [Salmonella enterica subsp. enterica serovar Saintpaul]EBB1213354.1 Arc family DNA-binding protein [Salmonella enterica]EBG9002827.1 Arc family DNA-binding protein [Salmonella enterica]EBH0502029.1 Arc family DNA-binding protein [Salmonella enterica]